MFKFFGKRSASARKDNWTDNPVEIRGVDDGVRSAADEATLLNARLDGENNTILLARPDVFNAPQKSRKDGTGEGYNFTALSRAMQEMAPGMTRSVVKIGNLSLFTISHVFRVANETNGVVQEAAVKCLSDMEMAINSGHKQAHLITDSSISPQKSMPHTDPCKETLACHYTDSNRFTLLSGEATPFAQMDIIALSVVMTEKDPAIIGFSASDAAGFDVRTGTLARIAGEKHRTAEPREHINGISYGGPGLQMQACK